MVRFPISLSEMTYGAVLRGVRRQSHRESPDNKGPSDTVMIKRGNYSQKMDPTYTEFYSNMMLLQSSQAVFRLSRE